MLRDYIRYLQHATTPHGNPLSQGSVTTYTSSLHAFTRWMHEEELTDTNVGARVKKPRAPKLSLQPFSDAELKRLIIASKRNLRDHAVLMVMVDGGMRASEVCTLTLDNVLLAQSALKVSGKGRKQRLIPLSVQTATALRRYLLRERQTYRMAASSPYVFVTERAPNLSPRSLLSVLQRIGKAANVDHCHPHKCRRTMATSFIRNGGDVFALQHILGHENLAITQRYVTISPEDLVIRHAKASPIANLMKPGKY